MYPFPSALPAAGISQGQCCGERGTGVGWAEPVPAELPGRCPSSTMRDGPSASHLRCRESPSLGTLLPFLAREGLHFLISAAEFSSSQLLCAPSLTFGDAECVVTTCYKIVKCNKEIGIALSGSKQVLLGAPSDGFVQCLGLDFATVGAVQGL